MELSGFGLDEETQNKIMEAYNASISGLKNKNSDLVEREGKAKLALEESQLKSAEDAENAKIALAESNGSIEDYKKAVAEKEEALSTLSREFQQKDNARLMHDEKTLFGKNISDDEAAQYLMGAKFEEFTEVRDGRVQPKDVSMTLEQLTSKIVSDEKYSRYIKAPVGSGAGAVGSVGGSASNGKASFSGTKQEQVNAAVAANPALRNLPLN
jgi:hypothetical protein